jgi:hypothetical protein
LQSFGKTCTAGAGRPALPFKSPQARVAACPAISCRGNIYRFQWMLAAMFIAQATDTPQMLRDVGSGLARQRRG